MNVNTLGEVSALARALVEAERATTEAEAELKRCKEHERRLREEDLPGAMQELGLDKIRLETGEEISTKLEVYASIPAARKQEAFDWLEANGFGGLIKSEITVPFSREELDKAADLAHQLQEDGFTCSLGRTVHPQTLKAFIKEQLAQATPVPLELFGAQAVNTAKVKL